MEIYKNLNNTDEDPPGERAKEKMGAKEKEMSREVDRDD